MFTIYIFATIGFISALYLTRGIDVVYQLIITFFTGLICMGLGAIVAMHLKTDIIDKSTTYKLTPIKNVIYLMDNDSKDYLFKIDGDTTFHTAPKDLSIVNKLNISNPLVTVYHSEAVDNLWNKFTITENTSKERYVFNISKN